MVVWSGQLLQGGGVSCGAHPPLTLNTTFRERGFGWCVWGVVLVDGVLADGVWVRGVRVGGVCAGGVLVGRVHEGVMKASLDTAAQDNVSSD